MRTKYMTPIDKPYLVVLIHAGFLIPAGYGEGCVVHVQYIGSWILMFLYEV